MATPQPSASAPTVTPRRAETTFRRVLVFVVAVPVVIWFALNALFFVVELLEPSRPAASAVPPPAPPAEHVVTEEATVLEAGQYFTSSIELKEDVEVVVSVESTGDLVDVWFMDINHYAAFQKAKNSLGGGEYGGTGGLSRQRVKLHQASGHVRAGNWHLVVDNPHDGVLGGEAARVSIRLAVR